MIIQRDLTTFESDYHVVRPRGLAKLAVPKKIGILGLIAGRLIIELREDWKSADGPVIPQGSVVAVELSNVLRAPDHLHPTAIYTPASRTAFSAASVTRDRLLLTELDNVKGRAYVYTPEKDGRWSHRALALADNATIDIVDTDLHSNLAFLSVTGFLRPQACGSRICTALNSRW